MKKYVKPSIGYIDKMAANFIPALIVGASAASAFAAGVGYGLMKDNRAIDPFRKASLPKVQLINNFG